MRDKFGFRLAVEAVDAAGESVFDLVRRLAHTREHHRRRISAGLQYAVKLAGRDDIEAGAGGGEQRQHGRDVEFAFTA